MVKKLKQKLGLSIIELIIFTAILSVIFVAILNYTAVTQKQISSNVSKTYALSLTTDLGEFLKSKSIESWQDFFDFATSGSPNGNKYSYCFNKKLNLASTVNGQFTNGKCANTDFTLVQDGVKNFYKREVEFTINTTKPNDPIKTTVTTYWQEFGALRNVQITYVYAKE